MGVSRKELTNIINENDKLIEEGRRERITRVPPINWEEIIDSQYPVPKIQKNSNDPKKVNKSKSNKSTYSSIISVIPQELLNRIKELSKNNLYQSSLEKSLLETEQKITPNSLSNPAKKYPLGIIINYSYNKQIMNYETFFNNLLREFTKKKLTTGVHKQIVKYHWQEIPKIVVLDQLLGTAINITPHQRDKITLLGAYMIMNELAEDKNNLRFLIPEFYRGILERSIKSVIRYVGSKNDQLNDHLKKSVFDKIIFYKNGDEMDIMKNNLINRIANYVLQINPFKNKNFVENCVMEGVLHSGTYSLRGVKQKKK